MVSATAAILSVVVVMVWSVCLRWSMRRRVFDSAGADPLLEHIISTMTRGR